MARQILSNLDFNSVAKIVGLVDPTSAQDAATKAYVDSAIEGLAWKDSCRVATQSNLNLAAPGTTIDGITMATNDRVLVRSQTAGAENGIYIFNGSAVAATRAPDMSVAAEVEQAVTTVEEGTSAGTTYRQSVVNVTLNTNTLTFSVFGTSAPSASETTAGIAEIATQGETDTGTDDTRFITPLKLATSTLRLKKYEVAFGDGSATSYNITHNLGTRSVQVEVFRDSGSYDTILCDVNRTSTSVVQLVFAAAPTTNQFRVVVFG